jgi:glycosyltransferase involved in cell wall biosynthesis
MSEPRSLVIVQPYVPKYRAGFFTRLIDVLEESNIECRVAAATPEHQQAGRDDAVAADWIIPIRRHSLRVGRRTLTLGGAGNAWSGKDAVIVGHLGSSIDTYRAILDAKRRQLRVGLWGHIKSYVADSHPLDAALERWQLRQAHHVFAYSPGGTAYAANAGVSPRRLTTVMNSVDTHALTQARDILVDSDARKFATLHGLKQGRTLGFIGGLDESKRIAFLAAVLEQLWVTDPDVKVVVGGNGSQAQLLNVSISRGQTILLGYVGPTEQALIGRVASALVMPGRIGLVAVDALLLQIPILTTDWPYHSAEAEYLLEGQSRFTSPNNVEAFVHQTRAFLASPSGKANPKKSVGWPYPTIESMVSNFADGVQRMMDTDHP